MSFSTSEQNGRSLKADTVCRHVQCHGPFNHIAHSFITCALHNSSILISELAVLCIAFLCYLPLSSSQSGLHLQLLTATTGNSVCHWSLRRWFSLSAPHQFKPIPDLLTDTVICPHVSRSLTSYSWWQSKLPHQKAREEPKRLALQANGQLRTNLQALVLWNPRAPPLRGLWINQTHIWSTMQWTDSLFQVRAN